MQRAPISAYLLLALAFGSASAATAQTASHHAQSRPAHVELASLSVQVNIAPTTMQDDRTSMEVGDDSWNARGYDLKTLIAEVYDIDIRRIDFPDDNAANTKYDVSLTLAHEVDDATMQRLLQQALAKKFNLNIAPESRSMDVYVLTSPAGPGTALHRHGASDDAQQITYFGKECSGVASGGIAVSAGTIPEFGRTLEPDLNRLVLDETNLKGSYDFKIGNYANQDDLFKQMHDQLGLVVTPSHRDVTVLTVRPAQELQAKL